MSHLLVLGTGNRKKGQELAHLLAPAGLELRTLADFPDAIDVVEDGDTFAANAELKAVQQARHLGQWVLADDSGLAVDSLDGAPGVLSARYSGPGARPMRATTGSCWTRFATFRGKIAVRNSSATSAWPTRPARCAARSPASCRGRILTAASGQGGFGYDPLFEIVEYHRSFGDLSPLVKSHLSHRSRAAARIVPRLIELFGG